MLTKRIPAPCRSSLSLPLLAISAALAATPADAAAFLWNNASGVWSAGAGWNGGVAPGGNDLSDVLTFSGDTGTTAGTPPNYTSTDDVAGAFKLNGLTFNVTDLAALPADPPIIIDGTAGSRIFIGGVSPAITQNNAGAVTLDLPLELGAPLTLTGDGTGAVTSNFNMSGLYEVTKNGASTFRFGTPVPVPPATGTPSENTWMGRLTINGGTVRFNNNAFSGPTALRQNPITLTSAGATLTCSSELRIGTISGPAGLVQSQVTGTNTSTENITIQAVAPGSFGGILRLGPPTGTGGTGGALVVRGPGEEIVTGTLDINKDLVIAGRLTLAGTASLGAQASGAISMAGGTFKLDNTVDNNPNRVRDGSATSTSIDVLGGGTFLLAGNAAGTTETAGRVQLGSATKGRSGRLGIALVHTAAAAPTVLTFGSLSRDTTTVVQTATVDFSARNAAGTALALGQAGNNPRIVFSTAPLATNGLIANSAGTGAVGFATVNGSDFAAHGANGVAAVATVAFPAVSTATANVLLTGNATVSVSAFALNSLKLQPAAAGQILTINSTRSLNVPGILLAGTTDSTIAGPGTLGGTGVHYYHVQQAVLNVSAAMPNQPLVKSGAGVLALTGTNSAITQPLVVQAGAVRARQGTTLPGGEIKLRGGVLELTGGGTFTRALGFAAGAINWSEFDTAVPPAAISEDRGSGGFAAIGADVTVDLQAAGATLIPWEDPGFVQSNFALVLGSPRADRKVTLVDNFQLNSTEATVKFSYREIRVEDNPGATTDSALISGIISGAVSNDLIKTGAGTLELSAANTFAGGMWVQAGTLLVTGSITGIATEVLTGATLAGPGSTSHILLESGGIISPGTSGTGTLSAAGCTWHGGGLMNFDLGPSSSASDRLALGSGPLRKGNAGTHTYNFAAGGANGFTYTLATFGSTDFIASDFAATNLAAGVSGYFQINGGNTLVFITGTPPPAPIEAWRQSYFGPGATDSGPAANGADPDTDGLTNLDEYGLGSSPLVAGTAFAPIAGRSGDFLTLTFPRNPAATDITLLVETSSTLAAGSWSNQATWTNAAGWITVPGSVVTETGGIVTWRDSVSIAGPTQRRCLRLRITHP